ncbi:uncharacterized protein FFB20_12062 [Fusarium fujikuroi]|uniref:Uncharacterized protein n=1 Tax=Fusarium fujikuroi TaxID=5127 RepID=A0A9Q9RRG8_FUSFU|nr:uncharacterized protein FFE2_07312 [Fusarium fujikuroi]SCO04082.1 uncharacterized protein FFB20_12062 [Fusarium fujikuroi]SCO42632.1 uncharacterized protein FFNC_08637 [Fusarium fujikuroi]SCV31981.1 uncharacterized protein FFFS_03073 [Fusarium fujikuroi]VTT59042.1 unnamed protein product [Fusarium fujikuroi]
MSLFATALLSLSFSTVVSAIPLVERQDNGTAPEPAPADPGVDCSPSSSTGLKPECWKALDMEKYINDWVTENGTKANCDELGFAQCYLQFNGFTGLTCNLITSDTCPPFNTKDVSKYDSNQQFYALWNIYTVYQFFNQYSRALSNGASLAGQTIDAIVAKVAPPVEANTPTSDLMNILGSTLGIVSIFTGLVPGDAGVGVGFIRAGLSAAFDLSGKLGETLTKTQTANDRFLQLGDIGSGLAKLVEAYQNNLLETVKLVQGDHTIFIAACQDGGFSQRVTTSLTIQASTLYRQLQLFILSSALKANGIVSAKSTGLNAQTRATDTGGAISCDALDPAGNCNQWWIDGADTYALHNPNDWRNNQIELTKAIVDEGWATLADVFKVEDCAGKEPTFNGKELGVTCLATHNWCEWNYQDSPSLSRSEPQWKNCDNDDKWGTLCGSFQNGLEIPESYLGPLLNSDQTWCKR